MSAIFASRLVVRFKRDYRRRVAITIVSQQKCLTSVIVVSINHPKRRIIYRTKYTNLTGINARLNRIQHCYDVTIVN